MTKRVRDRASFNVAWRRWYERNAKRKLEWQARRRLELRAWFSNLKASRSCEQCGETAPECLHFHHVDPKAKDITLAQAITNGWAKERILREIAKCRVLCANCHLKLHWEERRL